MGQNRRHPGSVVRDIARFEHHESRTGRPLSLSDAELSTTGPRSDAASPVEVEAWVTHRVVYDEPILVRGEAIAWTRRAVLVRWTADRGAIHHAWVYAGAVRRTTEDR